jgi:plastocyanin
VNAKRGKWNDKELIELALTLLAVIAGSLAAIGAFLSASYENQRVELERKPALLLSCRPEFRALDVAEGTKPVTNTALLTDGGARWIHLDGDGRGDTPQPFGSCALTNYGQLPVFNMRLRLRLQTIDKHRPSRTFEAFLGVPGLSPSSTYAFGLINAASTRMTFAFARMVTATRVDTGTQSEVPLFLSEELIDLERRVEEPQLRGVVLSAATRFNATRVVHINDFRYDPKVLHVRTGETITFSNDDPEPHTITAKTAFDSGSIDPGATWVHHFTRPGTYLYTCSFHPYMRGRIVVSEHQLMPASISPRAW